MSAACPACGVAVIPGYVRCPKCQAPLPAPRRAGPVGAGGTALEDTRRRFPYVAAIAGIVAGGAIVAVLAARRDHASAAGGHAPPASRAPVVAPSAPAPQTAVEEARPPTLPSRPDPRVPAGDLDRELKRQRLWGTVEVVGERVDVRSGGCGDPAMGPVIDAAIPRLREAGLTALRCMEQSGAVVFERDL